MRRDRLKKHPHWLSFKGSIFPVVDHTKSTTAVAETSKLLMISPSSSSIDGSFFLHFEKLLRQIQFSC